MYTFESFIDETGKALLDVDNAQLRNGQLYMNMLYLRRRDLHNHIAGTEVDPFYDNSRITEFWRYLKDNW